MTTKIEKMDMCMNPQTPVEEVIAMLEDSDWRVAMAAAVALGDRKEAKAALALWALLQREDQAPIFTQTEDYSRAPAGSPFGKGNSLPPDTSNETAQAWERRGRLKQSAIWALAAIGVGDTALIQKLQRYAVDTTQDYTVRASS